MLVCPQCGGTYAVTEGFCPMDGAPLTGGRDVEKGLVGRVLDRRYRLDRRIGTGAMGEVYQATHTLIGKRLAIKVLRDEHVGDPKVVQRFAQEARLASSIKHPNVVEISDFGTLDEGNTYFVMELLEGRTLADLVDNSGPVSPKVAACVALQIARGLGAAHDQSVVHRDLKAENVFLCDGGLDETGFLVKLLDFGIARAAGSRITAVGAMLGTPEYMSPEQARGLEVDARTDLYALGIIMFEMLTGRVPFSSTEVTEIIRQHIHAKPPTLAQVKPELDGCTALDGVIRTLLAKARDERPASAAEVVALLRRAMESDFGRETADRLHRSTLALGSATLSEPSQVHEAPRGEMGWGARTGATQRPVAPTPGKPPGLSPPEVVLRAPAASRPRPAPLANTDPASLREASHPRIGIIMGGTAVLAAVMTFAVVWVLGGLRPQAEAGRSTLPASRPHSIEPVRPSHDAAVLAVPAGSVSASEEPASSDAQMRIDPETTSPPDVVEAATPLGPPIPEPRRPVVRSNGDAPTPPKKTSRKRPHGAQPGRSPESPADDANSNDAREPSAGEAPPPESPDDLPKGPNKPSPGDLKDPFPSN
jgi:serine/threonine protein kinase